MNTSKPPLPPRDRPQLPSETFPPGSFSGGTFRQSSQNSDENKVKRLLVLLTALISLFALFLVVKENSAEIQDIQDATHKTTQAPDTAEPSAPQKPAQTIQNPPKPANVNPVQKPAPPMSSPPKGQFLVTISGERLGSAFVKDFDLTLAGERFFIDNIHQEHTLNPIDVTPGTYQMQLVHEQWRSDVVPVKVGADQKTYLHIILRGGLKNVVVTVRQDGALIYKEKKRMVR